MKKQFLLLTTAAFVMFSFSISSCNKTENASMTQALIDDWRPAKIAIDNGDGKLDASETEKAYSIPGDWGTLSLKESNTGIFVSNSIITQFIPPTIFGKNVDFNWTMDDRTQELTVTHVGGMPTTTMVQFKDMNNFAILQGDSTSFVPMWIFFERK